ncbi:hypothetical protein H8B06_18625 [Sphingobacterium sp. DN00404]|uniref:Uncharacterized protein n=1 Tax=Sphingobacterium micropteri TaxID=2763501 RepID=A0ABR7YU42_9SPHI|nr:hypothetical protein [Sphingobacterium micropteri]MBD1434845.1 hypothetical protein [Sphingobacterium micropteri]
MKKHLHKIKRLAGRKSFFRMHNKPLVDGYDGIIYRTEDHGTSVIFIQFDDRGKETIVEDFFTSRNIKRILSSFNTKQLS